MPSWDWRSKRDARLAELAELLGARRLEPAARELLLEVADPAGRLLEPPLLALVQPVEHRPRPQVAPGDGREDLRVGEAAGDAALERPDVVEQPLGDEVLEFLRARHVGGEVVEGAHDRRRARRSRRGHTEAAVADSKNFCASGRGRGAVDVGGGGPRGHDRGQEVDLVDHVLVHVGLREVEAQQVEGDLLVLRLHLLEEAAHVGGRDVAVGLAQLAAELVEPLGELAEARRDLLRRRRVDRAGRRAHVVVELAEVERVARLRGEERLLDATQELVERPQRLEPFGQANVVFVEKLDSLDGHLFFRGSPLF